MSLLLVVVMVLLGRSDRPAPRRNSERGTDFHQASDLALTAQTFETKSSARKNAVASLPALMTAARADRIVVDGRSRLWWGQEEVTFASESGLQGFLGRAPPAA